MTICPKTTPNEPRAPIVGKRLRMVRDVIGLGQGEFARRAGIAANTYNMIERGERLPSIELAIALCDTYGLTLDYVYRGDAAGLRHSLGRALEALTAVRTDE